MPFTNSEHLNKKRPITDKLGTFLWAYNSNSQQQAKAFADLGLKYLKTPIWIDEGSANDVSVFDPSGIKSFFEYEQSLGMSVISDLHSFHTGTLNTDTYSYYTPTQLGNIKACIDNALTACAGKGIIWEGWNEPNGSFWSPTWNDPNVIQAWTDFDKWEYQQVKAIDPNSLFCTLAMFLYPGYTMTVLNDYAKYQSLVDYAGQLGLFDSADMASLHPYIYRDLNNGSPEILLSQASYNNFPVSMQSKALITTEFSYAIPVSGYSGSTFNGQWDTRSAAALHLREILILDYLGYSIICSYSDLGGNHSILNDDCTPNMIGQGVEWLINELNGYAFDSKIEIVNHNGYIDDLYLMKYTKDGANDKLVYWAPSRIGELYGLVYQGNFYKLKFSDYPQILETGSSTFVAQHSSAQINSNSSSAVTNDDLVDVNDSDWTTVLENGE